MTSVSQDAHRFNETFRSHRSVQRYVEPGEKASTSFLGVRGRKLVFETPSTILCVGTTSFAEQQFTGATVHVKKQGSGNALYEVDIESRE